MARVFLSHSHGDWHLVLRLAEALRHAGHAPLLVEQEARIGRSMTEVVEQCLQQADAILLCLSQAALEGAWTQSEFEHALRWARSHNLPVHLVRFERVRPSAPLPEVMSVDLFLGNRGWDEGVARLLAALEHLGAQERPVPGNLPPAPAGFVGRHEELRHLLDALEPQSTGGRQASIIGSGGMGKTALALQFAHQEASRFPGGTWWVPAGYTAVEGLALLSHELRRVAPLTVRSTLDHVPPQAPSAELASAARQALERSELPSLLVIDDAEDPDWNHHLPGGHVSILVTTRGSQPVIGKSLHLKPLLPAEALQLTKTLLVILESPHTNEHEVRARVVSESTAGIPLAMRLVTAIAEQTQWGLLEQQQRSVSQPPLAGVTGVRTREFLRATIDKAISHLGRNTLLAASHLTENPFVRTEPPDVVIDRVFVGRVQQLREAALRMVDRPRNVLVLGSYGLGKTTFIRKLLRELHGAKTVRFLTGYAPLRSESAQGFQLAALGALAEGALQATSPGSPLREYALKVRDELARLDPSAPDGLRAPDLRFRDGLDLAHREGFKRVVIAIDEIDKRDVQVVQSILTGARFFLDLDASFVLTGRFLDAFSDIRASLLAAFDHRVQLRPFSPEECQEILLRNLQIARREDFPLPPSSPEPFEPTVLEEITRRAHGLPRPLNLMADGALEEALQQAMESSLPEAKVKLKHLESALRKEGNLIFNEVGADSRQLLVRLFQRSGYASGAELDSLSSGGLPEVTRSLEELSRRDAVLPVSSAGDTAFALSPAVNQALTLLQQQHDRLRALWSDALALTDANARGRALEDFAADFFGDVFKVVERNAHTATEELDLVLERTDRTDARFYETYLIVECKNWRAHPVDQREISVLASKMATQRRAQAFLLTSGRFTEAARRQAIDLRLSTGVEIILLDGQDLEGFLGSLVTVQDFLNEKHRGQTVLRSV